MCCNEIFSLHYFAIKIQLCIFDTRFKNYSDKSNIIMRCLSVLLNIIFRVLTTYFAKEREFCLKLDMKMSTHNCLYSSDILTVQK